MLNMRYKSFIWPNNPYSCQLSTSRELVAHRFPGRGCGLEDLGKNIRVLTGEGEFYGAGAYETMQGLLEVFYEGGTGVLVHPVIEMNRAWFHELELIQEPREDYVKYRFSFWEDGNGTVVQQGAKTSGNHSVQVGQNLWQIAELYGTTAEALLKANTWIQNPNSLTVGRMVVIP